MSADASGLATSNVYVPRPRVTPGRLTGALNVKYSMRFDRTDADSEVTVPAAMTRPRNAPQALSTTLRLNMI